jgi:hypothetical protein
LPTSWPTMPSADSCAPISSPRGLLSPETGTGTQVSPGKFGRLPRIPAGSTVLALDGYGLRDQSPARPAKHASYPVSVRQVAVLLHTAFRSHLAMTPLCFANPSSPSGWIEDFHFQAPGHAGHATKPLRGNLRWRAARSSRPSSHSRISARSSAGSWSLVQAQAAKRSALSELAQRKHSGLWLARSTRNVDSALQPPRPCPQKRVINAQAT